MTTQSLFVAALEKIVEKGGDAGIAFRAKFNRIAEVARYIFVDSDSTVSIGASATATERVFIDKDGNVGIGASPAASTKFYVLHDTDAEVIARFGSDRSAGQVRVIVDNVGGGDAQNSWMNAGTTKWCAGNDATDDSFNIRTGSGAFGTSADKFTIDSNGNISTSNAGATGMTNGFFYIPAAAGAPSGTPTSVTGHVPLYFDTTNNRFYVYDGGWLSVAMA